MRLRPRRHDDDSEGHGYPAPGVEGHRYPYKLLAAEMAEWADGKERGTVLPDNSVFGRDLDVVVGPSTYQRAKRFLAAHTVTNSLASVPSGAALLACASAASAMRRPAMPVTMSCTSAGVSSS